MISYREYSLVKTSSLESAMAQVDSMSDDQIEEFIKGKVSALGIKGAFSLVMQTLKNLASSKKTAATGDSGWAENQPKQPEDPRPSKLKQRLSTAGDWSYALAILLAIGTAGTSDAGGSWGEIFQGFAIASGTAFLGWALKKISSYLK